MTTCSVHIPNGLIAVIHLDTKGVREMSCMAYNIEAQGALTCGDTTQSSVNGSELFAVLNCYI